MLRLIAPTEPRTSERRRAIEDASRHHAVPVRTIERWVKRCDDHSWDLDAMGRKKPENSNGPRIFVSREFDKSWRAGGLPENELAELGEWVTRKLAGWWQSSAQRNGWTRVKLETLTDLQRHCREQAISFPRSAFHLSRRLVEELRFHSMVDVMAHDAKSFDDMKPRIRRDNSRFEPMRQVVVDVKPLDCVMLRPNGSEAYPKLVAFQDTGTLRVTGRIFLMSDGEGIRGEHVIEAFIAMATNPHWGFPQQIYRDNGKENLPFDLIREALKMTSGTDRVIINAKPYSGSSKPVESRFAYLDKYITSQMAGYTGKDRMNKKIQRVGRKATPYPGTIEEFEAEFFTRLQDLEAQKIKSGSFKGRSPMQVYTDHFDNGWRPVSVDPLALDAAFAKRIGERKIDRGAIAIDGDRFRHPELAAFNGRKVPVVRPYRRDSPPMVYLPNVGWITLEREMYHLPGDISGALESSKMQKANKAAVRKLKSQAAPVDPLGNVRERVAQHPTIAARAPLIKVMMSPEAECFAAARIEAERQQKQQPSAEQRLIARQLAETELLEKKSAQRG